MVFMVTLVTILSKVHFAKINSSKIFMSKLIKMASKPVPKDFTEMPREGCSTVTTYADLSGGERLPNRSVNADSCIGMSKSRTL